MQWEPEGGGKVAGLAGGRLVSFIKWINAELPDFNLPLETSEEELRLCLSDGLVLCSILDKLVPGSLQGIGSLNEATDVERFLLALDELGLPGFELSDLEQGLMVPVLQCLENLKAHFVYNAARENVQSYSRKRWDQPDLTSLAETDSCLKDASNFQHAIDDSVVSDGIASIDHIGFKSNELLQLKQGLHVDLSDAKLNELLKSNNLDSISSRFLFNILNRILSDIFERKNGDIPQAQRAACLLRKILQVIELRFSNQAESMKNQNNIFKAREGKYQTKLNAVETLAVGTTEENELVTGWVQKLKFSLQLEQTKFEEKKKLEEQDFSQLKKDKVRSDIEIAALKQDLQVAKRSHEEHVLQLELQASESKAEYEKRIQELKFHLTDARKQVKELKFVMKFVKDEVIKAKRNYSEEYKYFGIKLKGLAEAADDYHVLLTENRKLYNEVQDLKENIRVYCLIRPFLSGQSHKHTTVEFIGENGELIISNPLKHGNRNQYKKLTKKHNRIFTNFLINSQLPNQPITVSNHNPSHPSNFFPKNL